MIFNLLQSVRLLADATLSFNDNCAAGIEPNREKIAEYLSNSLMLATALNTKIGYDNAGKIVKKAYSECLSLKEATLRLGLLTEKEFDETVDPSKMIHP